VSPTVAIIGASGHGLWHRRTVHQLQQRGLVRLVALCDVRPVEATDDAPTTGVTVHTDHRAMLAEHRPDAVIVVTPPHTHLPIALDAVAADADVLLEKPPVMDLDEHEKLAAAVAASGRACQVGFQALGSAALAELTAAIDAGQLGEVTGVAVAGAWWRPDAYWTRSPWSGRRRVDGRRTLDGALVNAFAHGLMQCLAIAGLRGEATIEIERYRTRDIEVDDTAALRITGAGRIRDTSGQQLVVTAAVTLSSDGFVPGEITVTGTAGTAFLEYPSDRLRLPADPEPRAVPGRVGLLENLLDHRATGTPLIAPLARTAAFTTLVEAIAAAPPPHRIDPAHLVRHPEGGGRVIAEVAPATRAAAAAHALLSELGLPWTTTASCRDSRFFGGTR
jgi:predicted dehydrogenase